MLIDLLFIIIVMYLIGVIVDLVIVAWSNESNHDLPSANPIIALTSWFYPVILGIVYYDLLCAMVSWPFKYIYKMLSLCFESRNDKLNK